MSKSIAVLVCVVTFASSSFAQTTSPVSVGAYLVPEDASSQAAAISADGRFVVFESWASNLSPTPDVAWGNRDIFRHDRLTGKTVCASVSPTGSVGNGISEQPDVSGDGRWVVFVSVANDLVVGDTTTQYGAFVRDMDAGVTYEVDLSSSGVRADKQANDVAISADGRFVAFTSDADNLVAGDSNAAMDVFVRDLQAGSTTRVSVDSSGVEAGNRSDAVCISADGRYVAFDCLASNLSAADTNGTWDVFVHDRQTATTTLVSLSTAGVGGSAYSARPAISADGRWIVFGGSASNLVPGDTNFREDVFLRDVQLGQTSLVSVSSALVQGNQDSYFPAISDDGRYAVFASTASTLVAGDTNSGSDVFRKDLVTGAMDRMNLTPSGAQSAGSIGFATDVSGDGRVVVFDSPRPDLILGKTQFNIDVLARDVVGAPAVVYCTAKTNSLGCTPSIALGTTPSMSTPSGAIVTTSNLLANKSGLYFHGTKPPKANPFHGGWFCMLGPVVRGKVHSTGGTPGSCSGVLADDLDVYLASGADPALVPGVAVSLQAWSRDNAAPAFDSLSNALYVYIAP